MWWHRQPALEATKAEQHTLSTIKIINAHIFSGKTSSCTSQAEQHNNMTLKDGGTCKRAKRVRWMNPAQFAFEIVFLVAAVVVVAVKRANEIFLKLLCQNTWVGKLLQREACHCLKFVWCMETDDFGKLIFCREDEKYLFSYELSEIFQKHVALLLLREMIRELSISPKL